MSYICIDDGMRWNLFDQVQKRSLKIMEKLSQKTLFMLPYQLFMTIITV